MSKTRWIIFIVIVIALLGGLIVYSRLTSPSIDVSQIDPNAIQEASEQNGNIADHTYDADDGRVTLIEYGDYQCPYCAQTHPALQSVLEEYGSVVTFIFRNLPITTIHPNAKAAAAAAEAVGVVDREAFWSMLDLLYTNQSQWQSLNGTQRSEQFANYALGMGIDMNAYNEALQDGKAINQKIAFDLALADKQGATSTPTFYLNGEKLDTSIVQALQQGNGAPLSELLDQALADAEIELPEESEEE